MRGIKVMFALIAVLVMGVETQAGHSDPCGSAKCCGCTADCQPDCCKPVIVKPCHRNVYTYQRQCSTLKPPCCGDACPNACCGKVRRRDLRRACCLSPSCCDSGCCVEGAGLNGCNNGCSADPNCCLPKCCELNGREACCAMPGYCVDPDACCHGAGDDCCGDDCCVVDCCVDPCYLAQLIYESQTACYARHRRAAIRTLNRKYDCVCTPEIMVAFVYGLNDADQRVREAAADAIGDQLRKSDCCCITPCIVEALECALADCDRGVRREAEKALEVCGFDVIKGCCEEGCCEAPCCGDACAKTATATTPAIGLVSASFPLTTVEVVEPAVLSGIR